MLGIGHSVHVSAGPDYLLPTSLVLHESVDVEEEAVVGEMDAMAGWMARYLIQWLEELQLMQHQSVVEGQQEPQVRSKMQQPDWEV